MPDSIRVADYKLIERIGAGAYGEVWRARSTATGALRAVKVVYRSTFNDDRPFNREFEGIKKFEGISRSHPSQLAIFHVGRNDAARCFYYVMELADGAEPLGSGTGCHSEKLHPPVEENVLNEGAVQAAASPASQPDSDSYRPHTLRHDLQSRGRITAARVVELGLALTEALAHLHERGLVHRDIKPSNIIFVNGRPKLADIGLVTDASDARSIVGTEGYLAPEGPGTPQADIFALGKVLYEAATGLDRRQFPKLPPDLRTWPDAKLVFELNEIVLKACTDDRRLRYLSADQMRTELELLGVGKSVRRNHVWHWSWALCKKAGLATVALGLIGAGMFLVARGRGDIDLRSPIREVNNLVERGYSALLGETPEQISWALKDFQRAVELDPKCVPAYFGLFLTTTGTNSSAMATRLMELAPDLSESHVAAASVKWDEWRFREALAETRMATKMRTASRREGLGWAHTNLGWFLLLTGDPEGARKEYELAEDFLPTSPFIQMQLGHPDFVQRRFNEALKHYKRAAETVYGYASAYHSMALVYEERQEPGDQLKAIEEYINEADVLGKDKVETRRWFNEFREAFFKGGRKGYIQKWLERELSASNPDPYTLSNYYSRLGNKAKAYELLNRAIEEHSPSITTSLMFDFCWDHKDEEFQAIARKLGLME